MVIPELKTVQFSLGDWEGLESAGIGLGATDMMCSGWHCYSPVYETQLPQWQAREPIIRETAHSYIVSDRDKSLYETLLPKGQNA